MLIWTKKSQLSGLSCWGWTTVPDPKKVKAIKNCKKPTKKDV